MRFEAFERRAMEVWDGIPDDYRAGVDGLVLQHGAQPHPELDDVYTLGECLTESYPSDWGGPDTTRSVLVLYYGSFRRLARLDPDFDWDYEIWETVHHELRHHLESLATEDALEDVDYAVDENFKRLDGDPFDPWFYRSGEAVAPGTFDADGDLFIEIQIDDGDSVGSPIDFEFGGRRYAVDAPAATGDVTFLDLVEGVEEAGRVCLVLVRREGTLATLRRFLKRRALRVVQAEAVARPA